jgi:hypothetical protein
METGALLPDRATLDGLVTAMSLDSPSKQWLEISYSRTLLAFHGVRDHAVLATESIITIAAEALALATDMRDRGDSHMAAQVAHNAAQHLQSAINGAVSESAFLKITEQLAELRFREAKYYLDFLPERAMFNLVNPAYEQHQSLARILTNPRHEALGRILAEGILYFGKKYNDADKISRLLLDEDGLDQLWVPEVVRATVINSGYIGDEVGLQRKERLLRTTFDAAESKLDRVFLLEGLARAQAQIGKLRAIESLERAWVILDESEHVGVYSSLRHVQVVRAHLRATEQLHVPPDGELVRRANDALRVCKTLGYGRYEEEISAMLDQAS